MLDKDFLTQFEEAGRQMRMTTAKSREPANSPPDQDVGDHAPVETSENGSTSLAARDAKVPIDQTDEEVQEDILVDSRSDDMPYASESDPAEQWATSAAAVAREIMPASEDIARRAQMLGEGRLLVTAGVTALLNVPATSPARPVTDLASVLSSALRAAARAVPHILLADEETAHTVVAVATARIQAPHADRLVLKADQYGNDHRRRSVADAGAALQAECATRHGLRYLDGNEDSRRMRAHVTVALMTDEERTRAVREARLRRMPPEERRRFLAAAQDRVNQDMHAAEQRQDLDAWRGVLRDACDRYPLVKTILSGGHGAVDRLMTTAGLTGRETSTRTNPDHSTTTVTTLTVPTLTGIVFTRNGLQLLMSPLPGQPLAAWQAAAGALTTELTAPVTITQRRRTMVVEIRDRATGGLPDIVQLRDAPSLHITRSEKAATNRRGITTTTVSERLYMPVGVGTTGEVVHIELSDQPGLVVGGTSGSGKTATLKAATSTLLGRAELHLIDGKCELDWSAFRPYCCQYDNSGDLETAAAIIMRVERARQVRGAALKAFRERAGIRSASPSFWDLPVSDREAAGLFPIVLIVDECQIYTETNKSMSKDDRETQAEIIDTLAKLIRLGRSAGVFTILATQKPTGDTLPTRLRDNIASRLCLRVANRDAAVAVLAKGVYDDSPVKPDHIPTTRRGRAVLAGSESGAVEVLQGHYVTDPDLADYWAERPPPRVPDQLNRCQGLAAGQG